MLLGTLTRSVTPLGSLLSGLAAAALVSFALTASGGRAEQACTGAICVSSQDHFLGGSTSRIHVDVAAQFQEPDIINVLIPGHDQFEVSMGPFGGSGDKPVRANDFEFDVVGNGTFSYSIQPCATNFFGSTCNPWTTFTHYVSLPEPPGEPTAMPPVGEVAFSIDLPGNDYAGFDVQTAFQCRDACFADPNCLAWTFVVAGFKKPENAVCYLKNPVPAAALAHRCCTSGIAPPKVAAGLPAAGEIAAETDLWGNDYNNITVQTAVECRNACTADPSCLAWTFVQAGIKGPNPVCYFKNPIPTQVQRNACCSSGIAPPKVAATPAPAPAPAAPAPAAAPQATGGGVILADVDVYDVPGGGGNVLGFIDVPDGGGTVQVTASPGNCQDGWCHVAGPDVPGGQGWIWAEGFLKFQ